MHHGDCHGTAVLLWCRDLRGASDLHHGDWHGTAVLLIGDLRGTYDLLHGDWHGTSNLHHGDWHGTAVLLLVHMDTQGNADAAALVEDISLLTVLHNLLFKPVLVCLLT